MHGSRSKISSKKSRPKIHISRLKVNLCYILSAKANCVNTYVSNEVKSRSCNIATIRSGERTTVGRKSQTGCSYHEVHKGHMVALGEKEKNTEGIAPTWICRNARGSS